MKAAVLEALNKPLVVHNNWPDPKCGPQDAIVRVEANGICRSDWHIWVGDWGWIGLQPKLPQVIGHEFCGVLEEVGAELRRDPEFAPDILEDLEVVGVDNFADSAVVIKVRIKTQPIKQWRVGRELRRRIKKTFDAHGIQIS